MVPPWNWASIGALALLVIYQQFRVYRFRRESAKREELFQVVTENAADMIALVDVKGHRLYNSPAYKRILGYSAAELGETSAFEQIHPDDRFRVLEAAQEARSKGIGKKLEYRIQHKDGTWRILESVAGTIRDKKGEVEKLVIVNRDITDRKQAEQQAEHNLFHDNLTGLPNRRLFLDRLQQLFDHAQREPERQYALLFVDLDAFSALNEKIGPAAGDQVIVEMGRRLEACLRNIDMISRPQEGPLVKNAVLSRMGGDEFTILLEGVIDPSDAMRVGQRILTEMAKPLVLQGSEVSSSASIGIALRMKTHARAEDLLQDADVAMRRAKRLGGGRCELFDEGMQNRAVNRLKLEAELREAVAGHQFRVFYQPVLELQSKRISGFEALLRWQHPEQGLISPDKFVDAAEDTGLLLSIGRWLILETCKQLRSWQTDIPAARAITVSVNISTRQFAAPGFASELQGAIRDSGITPSQLQLELKEATAAADPKRTIAALSDLKHIGVGMILDDFGTGNSSLNGLRHFPAQALKIDRSLIAGMLGDRADRETIELIILVGHKLRLKVIAEGIETAKHCERLVEMNCDLGQGYFFSQPIDAKVAGEMLRQQTSNS